MDFREGSRVMVNLAPFIGSKARSGQSVPCRVQAVEEGQIQVATELPYREVSLWVHPHWIDGPAEEVTA